MTPKGKPTSNSPDRDRELRIRTAQRQAEALRMRAAGFTYRQIGQAIGVDVGTAHRLVSGAMAQIPETRTKRLRQLECERLDAMLRAVWSKDDGRDVLHGHPPSIAMALRISERRAALLGLDAPKQVQADVASEGLAAFLAQAFPGAKPQHDDAAGDDVDEALAAAEDAAEDVTH